MVESIVIQSINHKKDVLRSIIDVKSILFFAVDNESSNPNIPSYQQPEKTIQNNYSY